MSDTYQPTDAGITNLTQIKRFFDQIGRLGLSSESLYTVLTQASQGADTRAIKCDHPWDWDDFVRVGLLVLAQPHLKTHLSQMRGKSAGRWTGIVDQWDNLIQAFFYSNIPIQQLNQLLNEAMNEGIMKELTDTRKNELHEQAETLISSGNLSYSEISGELANMIIQLKCDFNSQVQQRIGWSHSRGATSIKSLDNSYYRMVDPSQRGYLIFTM